LGKNWKQGSFGSLFMVLRQNVTLRQVSITIVATENQYVLHILTVALVVQYAMCMSCTILSCMACVVLQYCSILLHKQHYFWKLLNIKCVFWCSLQLLSETLLILRRLERDNINVLKALLFLSDFNKTSIFSTDFCKTTKYQIPWEFVQWVPSCFKWIDGRSDKYDKANSCFLQFCRCT
jgi:hypothetical protein